MSAAYIAAVLENLPGTALVFDHFYGVKLMNDKLSELRRKLYHELEEPLQRKAPKDLRWVLLKNPGNLDHERNEPLAMANYMKEDRNQMWSPPGKAMAARALNVWIVRADVSGVAFLMRMGATLASYRFGIPAWCDHPVSSGPMRVSNKIKPLDRRAYGYQDLGIFKLRILSIHEARYSLAG